MPDLRGCIDRANEQTFSSSAFKPSTRLYIMDDSHAYMYCCVAPTCEAELSMRKALPATDLRELLLCGAAWLGICEKLASSMAAAPPA